MPLSFERTDTDMRHILPPELWDDPKLGAFLRSLGKHPEDASNLVKTKSQIKKEIDARIAADKDALEKTLRQKNEELQASYGRQHQLKPFFLIGDKCWNGEFADFLMDRLELTPYGQWNVAYLATTMETAELCNIPPHPHDRILHWEDECAKFIKDQYTQLKALHDSKPYPNMEQIHEFRAAQELTKKKIMAVPNIVREGLIRHFEKFRQKSRGEAQ
ncbi:hypothetical protein DYH55_11710 [Methylovirgula sp. 4M-Z18]|nr:hypothetical protein DYH55_11710 [Methylovirgula sp. 4M-Z18]